MTHDPVPPSTRRGQVLSRPWPLLFTGLVVTALSLPLSPFSATAVVLLRLGLILAGVVIAGLAVQRRMRTAGWALEERVETAGVVALAGFVALLAYLGMAEAWDSGRMLFGVMVGVALAGSVLILLPSLVRRVVLSLAVLVHFGGILTAVTSVEPPNAPAPWLSLQAWVHLYRPYLGFLYLNNAYHFYSPEPGPPTLAWFHIAYEDGSYRWVKLPVREESPVPLHYQRLLSLTESINVLNSRLPATEAELRAQEAMGMLPPGQKRIPFEQIVRRRQVAGATFKPEPIPMADELAPNMQYQEPMEYSKKMLSSYARYAARHFKHLENPALAITGIKIYRVRHSIIPPADLAAGHSPLEKIYYFGYFQGEFDANGELKDPEEPFLYWLLPIVNVPKDRNASKVFQVGARPSPEDFKILDCLEMHANKPSSTPDLNAEEPEFP